MMKPEEREKWVACLQNASNFKAEVQYYESTFSELMAARSDSYPARLKTDAFIRHRTNEAKNNGMAMNDLLMPCRVGTAAKEAECLAHFRLGLAAIALEQFRLAHGKSYPATLSDLPAQHSPDAPSIHSMGSPCAINKRVRVYFSTALDQPE